MRNNVLRIILIYEIDKEGVNNMINDKDKKASTSADSDSKDDMLVLVLMIVVGIPVLMVLGSLLFGLFQAEEQILTQQEIPTKANNYLGINGAMR